MKSYVNNCYTFLKHEKNIIISILIKNNIYIHIIKKIEITLKTRYLNKISILIKLK